MGTLRPMHELARQVGLDLPSYLDKVGDGQQPAKPSEPKPKA
jgi:hypothetical protein